MTIDRLHAIRLAPFAVMLAVFTIPAIAALGEAAVRSGRARILAGAVVVAGAVQFALFVHESTTSRILDPFGTETTSVHHCSTET